MTETVKTAPAAVKSTTEQNNDNPLNHVDYGSTGGPSLSVLWSNEPLSGQTLFLGGEVGCDGKIYNIPGHATRVLVIDPETDQVYPVGPRSTWQIQVVTRRAL
jgi:hypothetical protein